MSDITNTNSTIEKIDLSSANTLELANRLDNLVDSFKEDSRYQKCVNWGDPRPGHDEGTIAAHIRELEHSLEMLSPSISNPADISILRLLIHTHDTFKSETKGKVPISHPESHASLARTYVENILGETYLSNMLQYHDELYAIWRKLQTKGTIDEVRLGKLIDAIANWDLFMAFTVIDNTTASKSLEPTQWAIDEMKKRVDLNLDIQGLFNTIVADFK